MATAFAYVGGTVMSYVVYANWVGMRRWGMTAHPEIEALRRHAFSRDAIDYLPDDPAEVARIRESVGPLRWDVGMGAVVLFIVTAAFMVSGAAVLYPLQSRFDGWALLTEQRHVWSNIHGSLIWIYYIAIIAALWGTLQALPEVYARVMQEFGQAIRPARAWSYDRIKRVVCGYLLVTTCAIVWLEIPFDISARPSVAARGRGHLGIRPRHGSPSRAAGAAVAAGGRARRPAAGARLPAPAPQRLPCCRLGRDDRAGGRHGGRHAGRRPARTRRHHHLRPPRQPSRLARRPPSPPRAVANRAACQGLGGEVQIRISSVSSPVFSTPCSHHGGRWMKVPADTSRRSPFSVMVPRPRTIT